MTASSLITSMIEAARGLGARRLRILFEIVLPQVRATVWVALVLSFVTMLSALSVPMMMIAGSPTLLTVDMAWRVNSYGDYGVAKKRAADAGIKRGDNVVLSSGLIGKVVRVEDKEVGLEIAQGVTVKVVKSMVAEVRAKGEPAAANDAKN